MNYPIKLSEQIKFLIENKDFFLTFGPYTEPYEGKVVDSIINELKEKNVAIWQVGHFIRKRLKQVGVDPRYIFTVKEMEDKGIIPTACTEFALLTAAIFRKLGYPTAIAYSIDISSVFQHPTEYKSENGHMVNLVYFRGSWWLHDSTGTIPLPTKFIFTQLIQKGLIPGIIVRDLADVGIKDRFDEYYYVLYNIKDVLLLDLQEDIADQIKLLKFKLYIKQFEGQAEQ